MITEPEAKSATKDGRKNRMSHSRIHRKIIEYKSIIVKSCFVDEINTHVFAAFPNKREETGVHGNILDNIRPYHSLDATQRSIDAANNSHNSDRLILWHIADLFDGDGRSINNYRK